MGTWEESQRKKKGREWNNSNHCKSFELDFVKFLLFIIFLKEAKKK